MIHPSLATHIVEEGTMMEITLQRFRLLGFQGCNIYIANVCASDFVYISGLSYRNPRSQVIVDGAWEEIGKW